MIVRVYTYLSGISPITVLLIYLSVVPAFALIFCLFPKGNFYAPYAHMEPPALADAAAVEKNITDSMVRSYFTHDYAADGWQVARSDIQTDDLETAPSKGMTFTVYFFAIKHEGDKTVASVGGPQFVATISQRTMVTSLSQNQICHLVSLPYDAPSGPPSFNEHLLFRAPQLTLQADSICWGGNEEIAFRNLFAGWAGDPKGISGFGLRMLYFSATTITTVGFGDIVPLTAIARALTAIEAIAGWLLAGIFLNSLATRIARTRP